MSDYSEHGVSEIAENTSSRPGPVRRALAKVKNSASIIHDSKETSVEYHDDRPHPHPKVEDIVTTVSYSLIQEVMQYLKGPDGEDAMSVIFNTQSRVAANLALTEETRRAARVAAQEAIMGSYDGAERKSREAYAKIPPSLLTAGAILVGSYAVLLSAGLLFSFWRFALFGLQ